MCSVSDVHKQYQDKLITADQAAAKIENNFRVHFGTGLGSVVDIDEALAKRANELRGVTIITNVAIRKEAFKTYQATSSNENVRFHSSHFTGADRAMSKTGRQWYIPMLFRELQATGIRMTTSLIWLVFRLPQWTSTETSISDLKLLRCLES